MPNCLFFKHTLTTMLTVLFFMVSQFLSAQASQKSNSHPLSINAQKQGFDTERTATEFSGATALELMPIYAKATDIAKRIVAIDTAKTAKIVVNEDKFQDSTCIDLALDSVSVIKMTEKYIEIEYTIINKGTAPAPIFGSKKSVTDNVALHFYFSGTPRLNRGSILAEGIYLTEGLKETKGMLMPNASYKSRFKLSLEKKNRFYGVIILQLDAFDILSHECDETNNVYPIVPKWY